MKYIIATLIAAFTFTAMPAQGSTSGVHDACHYEDGSGQRICIWDGQAMGNGGGMSYIALRGGTKYARYVYISHRRAYRMTH